MRCVTILATTLMITASECCITCAYVHSKKACVIGIAQRLLVACMLINQQCCACRLCTSFAYTRPAVSQEAGQSIACWQQCILKQLAAPQSDDVSVAKAMQTCS